MNIKRPARRISRFAYPAAGAFPRQFRRQRVFQHGCQIAAGFDGRRSAIYQYGMTFSYVWRQNARADE